MDHTRTFSTFNPRSGEEIQVYATHSPEMLEERVSSLHRAQAQWAKSPPQVRARFLEKLATLMEREKLNLSDLATLEIGKLPQESVAEVEKCISTIHYYAENAEKFLQPQELQLENAKAYVCFEPIGIVLAIMPWNFPYWQAVRCTVPNLLAGNAILLKHASNVTGCALALEKMFQELTENEFPQLLTLALLPGSEALPLIADPRIAAVSFTGSTPVGRKIAEKCGAHLKKSVLELGGSDPYVILDDADIEKTAEICAQSRLLNAGQSCISAKRFIVVKSRKKNFEAAFLESLKKRTIAPLARIEFCQEALAQVNQSVQKGARLLLGGKYESGYFFPPTLLTEVRPGMPVFDEETFSPVAALIEAQDETEAFRLANLTSFGLGSALFTKDTSRGLALARRNLLSGSVAVNSFVKSDPRLPFGGIKASGYGRELGQFGFQEFCNIKTVVVN